MRIALGFDPDLHTTAAAVVVHDKGVLRIVDLRVFEPPVNNLKGQAASTAMCAVLSTEAAEWVSNFTYKIDIIVAEGQRIHRTTKNWDSITALGPVSGACLAATMPVLATESLRASIPFPDDWTGGIPKHVRQARMWEKWRVPYELHGTKAGRYSIPKDPAHRWGFKVGDWKHLGDAVGLALWGLAQLDGH